MIDLIVNGEDKVGKQLGGIIKINRIQKGLTLKYISYKTGLSISYLSKVERNLEGINEKNISNIFKLMDIEVYNENIFKSYEQEFQKFCRDVVFTLDFHQSYKILLKYEKYIHSSHYYISYLLAKFIYSISSNQIVKPKEYLFIEKYLYYLEDYQIQIYYYYLAVTYYMMDNFNQALEYYYISEKYKGTTLTRAMLNYHLATTLVYKGNVSKAIECACYSRDIFAKTGNIKRLVAINGLIAYAYSLSGNYKEATELFLSCIEGFQALSMKPQLMSAYNNLLYHYIRTENYQEIIDYIPSIPKEYLLDPRIDFYNALAFYKLDQMNQSKYYIKEAKHKCGKTTSRYTKSCIRTLETLLSHANMERKEKAMLNMKKVAYDSNDKDAILIVLKLIKDFYKESGQDEKMMECIAEISKLHF